MTPAPRRPTPAPRTPPAARLRPVPRPRAAGTPGPAGHAPATVRTLLLTVPLRGRPRPAPGPPRLRRRAKCCPPGAGVGCTARDGTPPGAAAPRPGAAGERGAPDADALRPEARLPPHVGRERGLLTKPAHGLRHDRTGQHGRYAQGLPRSGLPGPGRGEAATGLGRRPLGGLGRCQAPGASPAFAKTEQDSSPPRRTGAGRR